VKIRMLLPIRGVVENAYEDVEAGDIINIDDVKAAGWIELKWAAPVDQQTSVTERCLREQGGATPGDRFSLGRGAAPAHY
jgi:hypothetical protein